MHEKRFNREIERLRDPDRIARMEVSRVVDLVLKGLINPQTVLDVGTGSGLFAEQFAAKGMKVTGLDVNPDMLQAAQQFVPSGEFHIGVAEKIPLNDKSYDIVFMGLLLHEVDDLLKALSEANRVVKQRLAILEWPYEEQSFGPPLEHRLSFEQIETAAVQVGFTNIKQQKLANLVLYIIEK
ncbi:MAG: class I SAM-dependent methyltransferase [Chloroflexi bacterium]|nr:class I SAM-dependent methyltransferase [Chloroflexota bacterium]